MGSHIHQVLGQDRVPEEQSVQLQLRAQEEDHQDCTTWVEEPPKSEHATKAEVLGPEPELSKEIKIFNRSTWWCGDKLEYEADSRHAEVIIEECEW